mmetsp:Transcript_33975/g.79466  ORF Transcript_33975/g.79466 Transcript_33975/m.79466 type:complete len:212 (+) Transcript_33975:1726-2361(+)
MARFASSTREAGSDAAFCSNACTSGTNDCPTSPLKAFPSSSLLAVDIVVAASSARIFSRAAWACSLERRASSMPRKEESNSRMPTSNAFSRSSSSSASSSSFACSSSFGSSSSVVSSKLSSSPFTFSVSGSSSAKDPIMDCHCLRCSSNASRLTSTIRTHPLLCTTTARELSICTDASLASSFMGWSSTADASTVSCGAAREGSHLLIVPR